MARNRTQRYADFLVTDSITLLKNTSTPVGQDTDTDPKNVLESCFAEEPLITGVITENIESKAEELQKDLPPTIDEEKLVNIAVERLEAARSQLREGGYKK